MLLRDCLTNAFHYFGDVYLQAMLQLLNDDQSFFALDFDRERSTASAA